MASPPLLSVVVTSYTTDRMKDLFELLDSIRVQTYRRLETIFVAERHQELADRVNQYAADHQMTNLKVLFNSGEPGLSAARNLGIADARGDIIAFVDDDVVLDPDWAQEMVKAYADESVIGVTGPAVPLWEDPKMSWFPEELYWIISCTAWCDWDRPTEVRNAWGMNMSFRREAFDRCGGFSNDYGFHKGPMAEDNEFSLRVREATRGSIMFCPSVRLAHRVHGYRLTRRFIKQRAYWIGHSRRMVKRSAARDGQGPRPLGQEQDLLKRIIFRLFPSIAARFPTAPATSWRRAWVTGTALFYVGLGYYPWLPFPGKPTFKGASA